MSLETDGFEELMDTLSRLGDVGTKVGKRAVKNGLEEVLEQLKADAPKDSGDSAKSLSITSIKQYKGGSVWGACGIDSKNWNETKALWYQNYGYANWGKNGTFKGRRVDKHIGWIVESFSKSKDKGQQVIIDSIEAEWDRILGW